MILDLFDASIQIDDLKFASAILSIRMVLYLMRVKHVESLEDLQQQHDAISFMSKVASERHRVEKD